MYNKIITVLKRYDVLDKHIINILKAQFFIQLVGGAFFLILNIFLSSNGFSDSSIANFISFRFLAVMLLAFPLGFFIRGRSLKPFFILGSIGVPIVAILIVVVINLDREEFLPFLFIFWGAVYTCFQVSVLPYIMRNTLVEHQSHAISMSFATNSFGMILSGILIFLLSNLFQMDDGNSLIIISCLGFCGIYFLFKLNVDSIKLNNFRSDKHAFNWLLILKAVVPTLIIAIGAGLTIPFINLFFFHNFDVKASDFALIGSITSILVAFSALFVPEIKKRFGYRKGITLTQSLAVGALVLLATTEIFKDYWLAYPIALACYMFRAPLMNMAAPMTSELTMNYVGEKNQEMLSAIMAAIWSGSWYFSSQIFRFLIEEGFEYSQIFYITAVLYSFGILSYYLLILSYERK